MCGIRPSDSFIFIISAPRYISKNPTHPSDIAGFNIQVFKQIGAFSGDDVTIIRSQNEARRLANIVADAMA